MVSIAWVIAVLPLLAFGLILAGGRRLPMQGAGVGIVAMLLSLALSVGVLLDRIARHGATANFEYPWLAIGSVQLQFGWLVDPLTAVMLVVVTVVAAMVQIYSVGYMHGDPRFPLYYAYLNLFTAAMLGLVLSNNLVMLYACWEVMGLTSYLLIGFWFEKPEAMRAAKKAFIVTRIGDVSFLLGICWLLWEAGTADFSRLVLGPTGAGPIAAGPELARIAPLAVLPGIALLLFGGAVGKSAQFPLHVWLPDAMEGPTPVSALIHAATMVAAGVYLVARMFPVFLVGSVEPFTIGIVHLTPLAVVAWIGVITALLAALIALTQTDIKRVLAYSTISQLGYMMIGLGLGSLAAGTFHLTTHAFFKALLFLGAGSVIHGAGTQEIWQMGGLWRRMPWTFWTFLAGTLALAGIFPLAGFWSKDAILEAAVLHPDPSLGRPVFFCGLLGAFLTAFYMTRLVMVTFAGEWRGGAHAGASDAHGTAHGEPHESPQVMLMPLVILAVLAVTAGWVGTPWANGYDAFVAPLSPGEAHAAHGPNYVLMLTSLAVALAGGLAGFLLYPRGQFKLAHLSRSPVLMALYAASRRKFYFDEIYWRLFVIPFLHVSRFSWLIDRSLIDGIVNLAGWLTVRLAAVYRLFDLYIVDGLVNLCAWVTKRLGGSMRYLQTGQVQSYILAVFVGAIVIVWWFLAQ
jgi:NADH-quinone oxidoreductase subunit L